MRKKFLIWLNQKCKLLKKKISVEEADKLILDKNQNFSKTQNISKQKGKEKSAAKSKKLAKST